MYEYYDEYERAGKANDKDAQGRWARQFIWEVARHAVGEEIVVYPLMEQHLGAKGKELADNDRADHQVHIYLLSHYFVLWNEATDYFNCILLCFFFIVQVVKSLLYSIESLTPGSSEYDEKLSKVMKHLKPHNDSEETEDLPMLEPKLGVEGSKAAAASFSRTKKFVPTRFVPCLFRVDCWALTVM